MKSIYPNNERNYHRNELYSNKESEIRMNKHSNTLPIRQDLNNNEITPLTRTKSAPIISEQCKKPIISSSVPLQRFLPTILSSPWMSPTSSYVSIRSRETRRRSISSASSHSSTGSRRRSISPYSPRAISFESLARSLSSVSFQSLLPSESQSTNFIPSIFKPQPPSTLEQSVSVPSTLKIRPKPLTITEPPLTHKPSSPSPTSFLPYSPPWTVESSISIPSTSAVSASSPVESIPPTPASLLAVGNFDTTSIFEALVEHINPSCLEREILTDIKQRAKFLNDSHQRRLELIRKLKDPNNPEAFEDLKSLRNLYVENVNFQQEQAKLLEFYRQDARKRRERENEIKKLQEFRNSVINTSQHDFEHFGPDYLSEDSEEYLYKVKKNPTVTSSRQDKLRNHEEMEKELANLRKRLEKLKESSCDSSNSTRSWNIFKKDDDNNLKNNCNNNDNSKVNNSDKKCSIL